MLDMIMDLEQESKNIWKAMQSVFAEGFSTPDLSNTDVESKMIGTDAFGDKIVAHLKNI